MNVMQHDLFGEPSPTNPRPGFAADAIMPEEERSLVVDIDMLDLPPFLFQCWISGFDRAALELPPRALYHLTRNTA